MDISRDRGGGVMTMRRGGLAHRLLHEAVNKTRECSFQLD